MDKIITGANTRLASCGERGYIEVQFSNWAFVLG